MDQCIPWASSKTVFWHPVSADSLSSKEYGVTFKLIPVSTSEFLLCDVLNETISLSIGKNTSGLYPGALFGDVKLKP